MIEQYAEFGRSIIDVGHEQLSAHTTRTLAEPDWVAYAVLDAIIAKTNKMIDE